MLKSAEPVTTPAVLPQALPIKFLSPRLSGLISPPHPLDACWGTSQMCSDDMSEFVFSCPLVLPFGSLRLFRHPLLTHRGCNAYENRSRVTLC